MRFTKSRKKIYEEFWKNSGIVEALDEFAFTENYENPFNYSFEIFVNLCEYIEKNYTNKKI